MKKIIPSHNSIYYFLYSGFDGFDGNCGLKKGSLTSSDYISFSQQTGDFGSKLPHSIVLVISLLAPGAAPYASAAVKEKKEINKIKSFCYTTQGNK